MTFVINPDTAFQASRFRVCIAPLIPNADAAYGGYTLITKYMPTLLRSAGMGMRLILRGPTAPGSSVTLSNVSISLAANASTSDMYDSAVAPTAVTFRSSASVALARNGYAVSDEIAFSIDGTRAILLAYNVSSAGGGMASLATGLSSRDVVTYRRAATSEAGTQNRTTGYGAAGGASAFLYQLETFG